MAQHNYEVELLRAVPGKVGWRVREWHTAVGCSRAHVWNLIAAKQIRSVKAGNLRIITTSPHEFLAGLAKTASA
jgi:hypothetical protein